MRYLLALISMVILAVSLSACGPIYKTTYDYQPPASSTGKMCVTQCMQNKTMCQQMCSMRNETCLSQARQKALYDYEIYKAQQERNHKPVTRTLDSFNRSTWECQSNCDCEANFNICYSTCGGQVVEKKVCTAFCDQQSVL